MRCKNTIDATVANGLCAGCGVCAGICPADALHMSDNEYGEYIPVLQGGCIECGACLKVCPFRAANPSESVIGTELFSGLQNIKPHSLLGWYTSCYVGWVSNMEHRMAAASGGLASWLLCRLLETDRADFAVCVAPNNNPERLFSYKLCKTPQEVQECAGSAYYPVELSDVLSHIRKQHGRYAVIALPCSVKALRLAMKQDSILNSRIKYLVGLTCNQMKSKLLSSLAIEKAGAKGTVTCASFRRKNDQAATAKDFLYSFRNAEGEAFPIPAKSIGWHWDQRLFSLQSCCACDDVFAELSDVSFMDAWLPAYEKDSRGTSALIVRNPELEPLIQEAYTDGLIGLLRATPEEIVRSQAMVIEFKRLPLKFKLPRKLWTSVGSKRSQPLRLRRIILLEPFRHRLVTSTIQKKKKYFIGRKRKNSYHHKYQCWQDVAVRILTIYSRVISLFYKK